MPRAKTIGERGRRFTVQIPLETPDGFGGLIRTYQPGPQLWGAIEMLAETDRVRAGRPESAVTHRVTLDYRADVTERMQLTLGPRRFRVRAAVDPDGRRGSLVCLVEEIGP